LTRLKRPDSNAGVVAVAAVLAKAAKTLRARISGTVLCDERKDLTSLRDLPTPEWCGTSQQRVNQPDLCEAAFIYYEDGGETLYARCEHDEVAETCEANLDKAVSCQDSGFCRKKLFMKSLRDLNEQQWCGSDEARASNARECERAYVYYEEDGIVLYAPCVYHNLNGESGVCMSGDGVECRGF